MDVDEITAVAVIALLIRKRKQNKRRNYWVHPLWCDRLFTGKFYTLHAKLKGYPKLFFRYYRMSVKSFEGLLLLLTNSITFQDTNMRLSIPPEERLAITLRYLATGASMNGISFEFMLGVSTVSALVKSTCKQMWNVLQPLYMAEKDENDWLKIADEFYERTNFPNLLGAIDGKHIRIVKPHNSGSKFINYKKFFSIVLMAWVDADYKFVYVDVGSYGAAGDSTIFSDSNIGKRLENNLLKLPKSRKLPGDENGKEMPFNVASDEAFALSRHVLRPYARKSLSQIKRIYNYRHSRARGRVECAFGILANKWRIFHRPLDVDVKFADVIVKACCVLHNYVREHDGIKFSDTAYECNLESIKIIEDQNISVPTTYHLNRMYLAKYFVSPQGSIPWQYRKI